MFQGTILNGEGFKITEEVADELVRENPNNSDVILPFIGGNEVNSDPCLKPVCWVVNFWDWPEEKAMEYELPYRQVLERVKPERQRKNDKGQFVLRKARAERWWQFSEKAQGLYHAVGRGHLFESHPQEWDPAKQSMQRVLVVSRGVTKYPAFTFLENRFVFSEKLYVLADDRYSVFGVLSSDVHAVWAWAQKTSLGGDLYSLSYTHGNIFETFPFPDGVLSGDAAALSTVGQEFCEDRSAYMLANNKGLTKLYNDFHDVELQSVDIARMRSLQVNMNNAVFAAYGFDDIEPEYGFHEVGYLPSGNNLRFSISEKTRLNVLRRLAKLNKSRHEERAGANSNIKTAQSSPTRESVASSPDDLFATGGGKA
jgi:hypothetical protein